MGNSMKYKFTCAPNTKAAAVGYYSSERRRRTQKQENLHTCMQNPAFYR